MLKYIGLLNQQIVTGDIIPVDFADPIATGQKVNELFKNGVIILTLSFFNVLTFIKKRKVNKIDFVR